MRTRRVLLQVVGAPPGEVAAEHGDFAAFFRRAAGDAAVELVIGDGLGTPLPDLRAYDGVIMTGSPASLTEPEPWMEEAVELVRQAHESGTPLLGVCFGHQVIGAAFGGAVVENPSGWEISTWEVELSPAGRADPLFADLPGRFAVNCSHRDAVAPETLAPGNGITVLAGNRATPVQALAAGPAIRGVQFHPEFDGAIVRAYVRSRADRLTTAGHDPAALERRGADTPHGRAVLTNFLKYFVMRA
ncbi:MAG TPA: gamma-glutamyl-gamma-aminobutyrate hydrolase family protein [Kofleriaceae bacterium]|nr:gamma-glutamyl-gamma-aminobutyrate hydrolase family protein [Kofleriaceae bacterium]